VARQGDEVGVDVPCCHSSTVTGGRRERL